MRAMQNSISTHPDTLAGVLLRCPCGGELSDLRCLQCRFRLEPRNGIVHALLPGREEYYRRFVEEYGRVRQAEGRGSQGDAFYLRLPYADLTGKNSRQWQIRARSFDRLMSLLRCGFPVERAPRILDLGAGNGWMSYRLATAGYQPFAVDLTLDSHDGLGAAEHYRSSLSGLFPRLQAEMDHLPFLNAQFDVAIFNASFHYAQNYETTLREALRCVKSGGMVAIVDSPWYSQDESGQRMITERQVTFLRKYGTASNAIEHREYLTDERLGQLEATLAIEWEIHSPSYGFRWAIRPVLARLRGRREPSRFRIYTAWKPK